MLRSLSINPKFHNIAVRDDKLLSELLAFRTVLLSANSKKMAEEKTTESNIKRIYHTARYSDKRRIVDILCKSFDSNISVNYVVKQDRKRKERIRALMDYSFELCYMFGTIYLTENKESCALVLFPDKKKTSLKTILLDAKLALLSVGLKRVFKILQRDSKIKNCYPSNQILYLWFIGVNPDSQHMGIGSSMLESIIADSIKLNRPIYLETSMSENVKFYNKHGFSVYNELDFGHKLYLISRACISQLYA